MATVQRASDWKWSERHPTWEWSAVDGQAMRRENAVREGLDLQCMRDRLSQQNGDHCCDMPWVFAQPFRRVVQHGYYERAPIDELARLVPRLPDEVRVHILRYMRGWSVALAVLAETAAFGDLLEMVACCQWPGLEIQGAAVTEPEWTFFPVLLDRASNSGNPCIGSALGYSIGRAYTRFSRNECRRRHAFIHSVFDDDLVWFENPRQVTPAPRCERETHVAAASAAQAEPSPSMRTAATMVQTLTELLHTSSTMVRALALTVRRVRPRESVSLLDGVVRHVQTLNEDVTAMMGSMRRHCQR